MNDLRLFSRLLALGTCLLIAACTAQPAPAPLPPTAAPTPVPTATPTPEPFVAVDATEQAAQLGRGINFGNMLEAPVEGAWGIILQESYFDAVQEAGFQTIRLPVRWSAHASDTAPYTINEDLLRRVDWAIAMATQRDLNIVVNMHHYQELMTDGEGQRARFAAMWKQIAERYKDQPSNVLFELLNEPNAMSAKYWNQIALETLAVVRESNPTRNIVLGGADFNSVNGLLELKLPKEDPHLIATFHYYLPFEFTHQGADWVNGSGAWLGKTWGTSHDKTQLDYDLYRANQWSKDNARPVWLGEFGVYKEADMDSRIKWTTYVAREAEKRSINWAYWEFGADFGAYDRLKNEWNEPLLRSLIP